MPPFWPSLSQLKPMLESLFASYHRKVPKAPPREGFQPMNCTTQLLLLVPREPTSHTTI